MSTPPLRHNRADMEALARWVAASLEQSCGIDSCILATALLVDVLPDFGIRAQPFSVGVLISNRQAIADLRDPDAWVIGLGVPRELRPEGVPVRVVPGRLRPGWDGHLVALTERFLIDPTLPQASRPERGLHLEPLVLPVSPAFASGQLSIEGLLDGGGRLGYYPAPNNRAWRTAPDWRNVKARRLIADKFRRGIRLGAWREFAQPLEAAR